MTTVDSGSRRLAYGWALAALIALTLCFGVFQYVEAARVGTPGPNSLDYAGASEGIQASVLIIAVTALGLIVTVKQPENACGPLLLAFSLCFAWQGVGALTTDWVLVRGEAPEWFGVIAAWLGAIGIFGSWALVVTFLLRFPNGSYVTRRWRWAGRAAGLGAVLSLTSVFSPRFFSSDLAELAFFYAPRTSNPLAAAAVPTGIFDTAFLVGIALLFVGLFGGLASLVVRAARSNGEERQQVKVVAFGLVTFALLIMVAANLVRLGGAFSWLFDNAIGFLALVVVGSFGVALLRYRLYDFDVVINKTIVYGTLIVFITAVFAIVAFAPFLVLGMSDDVSADRLALPLVATVVLVLAFNPVRQRLQKTANRLVYGRRASPYEALSEFSSSLAASSADEDLLNRTAEILAEGTGAQRAAVWLVDGGELRAAAGYPDLPTDQDPGPTLNDGSIESSEGMLAVEIAYRGELLGVLTIKKKPGDPARPIERRLVADLASQAGVVLRNFTLTEELRRRLDQLQASRQRLVAAQDQERRRLERDLHDGAQQQLVALKIKLSMVGGVDDADRRETILTGLISDVDEAIDQLRDLARGIYPPALAQEGLVRALRGYAAKLTVPTEVTAHDVGRYAADVEAAVYYCTMEALQNVVKYADAGTARVVLRGEEGVLRFEVADNGRGFDTESVQRGAGLQNMEDRIEALGGVLTLTSSPASGTIVSGAISTRER